MTSARPAAFGILALAAASWLVVVRQMQGMDMGVATTLGSFGFFLALWVSMMAAMMLPGAVPAAIRHARARGRARALPPFVASYLAVWTLAGVVVYPLYRPHGALASGLIALAAGAYELTPLKQHFRRRCREDLRSGLELGIYCVGSSIGLMLMLLAVGPMSIAWMSVITAVVVLQKLLPPTATIDLPLALATAGFGVLVLVAPAVVPGLTAS
jgi:predicted metal-binding membrane protein